MKIVYDAQDLQKKLTEQCKQMAPSVRALFTVCEIDGKTVVTLDNFYHKYFKLYEISREKEVIPNASY